MPKRKHHETCPHCAFMQAFKLKYGGKVVDEKSHAKAFHKLTESALLISKMVFKQLEPTQRLQFLQDLTGASGDQIQVVDMSAETKH